MSADRKTIFPLIRHLSRPVTGVLATLPVSANQITAASLIVGLGAAWAAAQATQAWAIGSGALLIAAYVLDNCDGEIARLKNQCSTFGMHFDTFVDWLVHGAFFWALGHGTAAATGQPFWNWMGLAAALGGTINYFLSLVLAARDRQARDDAHNPTGDDVEINPSHPKNAWEWAVFALRELSRADFCFIVLALALFDGLWILLPAGAIGAQAYWMAAFIKRAREFHV